VKTNHFLVAAILFPLSFAAIGSDESSATAFTQKFTKMLFEKPAEIQIEGGIRYFYEHQCTNASRKQDWAKEMIRICNKRGGSMQGPFCLLDSDQDRVLMIAAAKDVQGAFCDSRLGPRVSYLVAEPNIQDDIESLQDLAKQFGYKTSQMRLAEAEEEKRRKAIEEEEQRKKWEKERLLSLEIDRQRAIDEKKKRENEKALAAARAARAKTFQSSMKIGSVTNCGPVIETKGELVKVYFPVKDYGNEHWISIKDLYPPDESCNFVNGRYQPR
jgi:hypothetical protein